jgi:hypothetical protein
VSTSVVKWSNNLSSRVSAIVRSYIDHMRFVAYMAIPFIKLFHFFYFISLYMWLYILYASVLFCKVLY